MENDEEDITLHELERIEANLTTGQPPLEPDDGLMQASASTMVQSATSFAINAATGFMIH